MAEVVLGRVWTCLVLGRGIMIAQCYWDFRGLQWNLQEVRMDVGMRASIAILNSVGNCKPLLSLIGKWDDIHIEKNQLETGKEHLPCVRHSAGHLKRHGLGGDCGRETKSRGFTRCLPVMHQRLGWELGLTKFAKDEDKHVDMLNIGTYCLDSYGTEEIGL